MMVDGKCQQAFCASYMVNIKISLYMGNLLVNHSTNIFSIKFFSIKFFLEGKCIKIWVLPKIKQLNNYRFTSYNKYQNHSSKSI